MKLPLFFLSPPPSVCLSRGFAGILESGKFVES